MCFCISAATLVLFLFCLGFEEICADFISVMFVGYDLKTHTIAMFVTDG
jgi:hypothetical protein